MTIVIIIRRKIIDNNIKNYCHYKYNYTDDTHNPVPYRRQRCRRTSAANTRPPAAQLMARRKNTPCRCSRLRAWLSRSVSCSCCLRSKSRPRKSSVLTWGRGGGVDNRLRFSVLFCFYLIRSFRFVASPSNFLYLTCR